jgi:hypothetical protein
MRSAEWDLGEMIDEDVGVDKNARTGGQGRKIFR